MTRKTPVGPGNARATTPHDLRLEPSRWGLSRFRSRRTSMRNGPPQTTSAHSPSPSWLGPPCGAAGFCCRTSCSCRACLNASPTVLRRRRYGGLSSRRMFYSSELRVLRGRCAAKMTSLNGLFLNRIISEAIGTHHTSKYCGIRTKPLARRTLRVASYACHALDGPNNPLSPSGCST